MAKAQKNLEPAQVGAAVFDANEFTALRRWVIRPDRVRNDPFGNPSVRATMHAGGNWDDVTGESGPEDPDFSLVSFQSLKGRPIAVLSNFSMHYFSGGIKGVNDAISVIDRMVGHPSTSEFICQKLINKFVSDEISLTTYHSRTAPAELLELMDEAIKAWHSTKPAGDITKVMRVILDPRRQQSAFWQDIGYRGKIKTPIEYINSSLRALDADISGTELPEYNSELGMELFVRDDPDGYSEFGLSLIHI